MAIFSGSSGSAASTLHLKLPSLHPLYTSKILRTLVRIFGAAFFILVISTGLFGTQNAQTNLTPTALWVLFGVGLTFFTMLIGDIWSLLHPIASLLHWCKLPRRIHHYPVTWSVYPALVQFFLYRWIENIFRYAEYPRTLAIILIIYALVSFIGMIRYSPKVWLHYGDPFGVFFRLISTTAIFETGKGNLLLRVPGATLSTLKKLTFSETLFILLMLASVAFDSLKSTTFFQSSVSFMEAYAIPPVPRLTLGFIALIIFYIATYFLFAVFVELFSGRTQKAPIPWRAFGMTFIPIAVGYELAHYLRFLLVEGQRMIPLLSDPFGFGWNIFGTARNTINETLISPEVYWRLQVAFIVVGHIIAVVAAHHVALRIYQDKKMSFLSQIPMIVLMIGYTVFSLWILQAS